LRNHVDYLRPYELIERVLTRHDGRRRLLARLGAEAEDGIDALLSQAMAYERNAVGSLTGFLVWMETDDLEIKRQTDSAGDRIRVMTVHGAKGLQAPIVILPDTARRQGRDNRRNQLALGREGALWRMTAAEAPEAQIRLEEAASAAERAERDRLLYVAMTRAEQWLIVAASGDPGADGDSWYDKLRIGLGRVGARAQSFEGGAGLRHEYGVWDGLEIVREEPEQKTDIALPDFFRRTAPEPARPQPTLSPSDLGGAKALADERGLDEAAAKRRGRQVHRLLEWLPTAAEAEWPGLAARLLSAGEDAAQGEELALLLNEAAKVLRKPSLASLFAGNTLAEVPISTRLGELGGRRVHGVIDRLVIAPDHVRAIDFKTNAMVPERPVDCPDGLLRQMGAYAAALAQIYPGRRVETALLWTRTATLMPLPHDLVSAALQRAGMA